MSETEYQAQQPGYDFKEFAVRVTEVVISGFLMGVASAAGQRIMTGRQNARPALDVADDKVTPLRKVGSG